MTLRALLHLLLHAAVPALVAWAVYRGSGKTIGFRRAWGLLLLGNPGQSRLSGGRACPAFSMGETRVGMTEWQVRGGAMSGPLPGKGSLPDWVEFRETMEVSCPVRLERVEPFAEMARGF